MQQNQTLEILKDIRIFKIFCESYLFAVRIVVMKNLSQKGERSAVYAKERRKYL